MTSKFIAELDKAIDIAGGQSQLARIISHISGNPRFTQSHIWTLRNRDAGLRPELAVLLANWAIGNGVRLDVRILSPSMDWDLAKKMLA